MHPSQFQVNEVWIAFKLNDAPIITESDGDFNFIALMDAASCFILSSTPVSASAAEPSTMEVRRLLKQAHAHKQQWPQALFVSSDRMADYLTPEAEDHGITVVRVLEEQLLTFIGEAREEFKERLGGGSLQ
jgi:hypothetical protein